MERVLSSAAPRTVFASVLDVSVFAILAVVSGLFFAPRAGAQSSTIKPLFVFSCDSTTQICPQGETPTSLIQSANGNFYGTTESGGPSGSAAGTVFKLSANGQLTLIHTFLPDGNGNYVNGSNPTSVVEGNDGFLYGTASGGTDGQGIIFKLSKTGAIAILHNFCSSCGEGGQPFNLVLGNDGNFYGCTTFSSPATLFRVTPTGSFSILHTFQTFVDGPQCIGILTGADGNIYGDTVGGLAKPTTLFRVTPVGQVTETHIWHYSQFPVSPLTQTSDGKLWGLLTHIAGSAQPAMFAVAPSGSNYEEIALPSQFDLPYVEFMTQASDGNFWGTKGTDVLTFTPGGTLLQQMTSSSFSGDSALTLLLQAENGVLLGLANQGLFGGGAAGEVFTISPSLAPPKPALITFNPTAGLAGSRVLIHGTHFIGATGVKFNGVSTTFQVLNTGNIRATAPTGATTGSITVTNKGGEATSASDYTVE